MIGWLGNILICVGLWKIGNKQRSAFLWTCAGEVVWIFRAVYLEMADLAAICVVFAALAIRNYIEWGKGEKDE